MDMIDLEIYRWKWFRDIHLQRKSVQNYNKDYFLQNYWKEVGAFVSVLPRQTGKTTMIFKMIDIIKTTEQRNWVYVTSNEQLISNAILVGNLKSKDGLYAFGGSIKNNEEWFAMEPFEAKGSDATKYHLFIDEFDTCNSITLNYWLNHRWASVTMVGTLR